MPHHIAAILSRKVVLSATGGRVPPPSLLLLFFLPLTTGAHKVALIVVEVVVPLQIGVVLEVGTSVAFVALKVSEVISCQVLLLDVLLQKGADVVVVVLKNKGEIRKMSDFFGCT